MLSKKEIILNAFVIICLAVFSAWYAYDAYQASSSLDNLILVFPVVIAVLILCVYQFFIDLNTVKTTQPDTEPDDKPKDDVLTVIPVIVLFALYVLTLEYLGFDVGTVLFLAIFLVFHGERRIAWILGYSLVYGFLVAYFFSMMLPYPMPMMLLPTDY